MTYLEGSQMAHGAARSKACERPPAMTKQEEKRLDDLMSKPYPLTKPERRQLRQLLAKSREAK